MTSSEIGRELKVTELKPRTIVCLTKAGRTAIVTVWVVSIGETYVHFRAAAIDMEFLAERTGPHLEQITDDTHAVMKMFEYLGKP